MEKLQDVYVDCHRVEPSYEYVSYAFAAARWIWGQTGMPFAVVRLAGHVHAHSALSALHDKYPFVLKRVEDDRLLNLCVDNTKDQHWMPLYGIGVQLSRDDAPNERYKKQAVRLLQRWLALYPLPATTME